MKSFLQNGEVIMPKHDFKLRGIRIQIWEKSFRVEGQDGVIFTDRLVEKKEVESLVNAIYGKIKDKAREDAKKEVINSVTEKVTKLLG